MKAINEKIKIQALNTLDAGAFLSKGFIEILCVENQEAYVSWQMFDKSESSIASVSRRYYLGNQPYTKDKIIEMAIANIENFRVGRKHIFSDVKIDESETLIN